MITKTINLAQAVKTFHIYLYMYLSISKGLSTRKKEAKTTYSKLTH
jgi:hypothetical protein